MVFRQSVRYWCALPVSELILNWNSPESVCILPKVISGDGVFFIIADHPTYSFIKLHYCEI